MDYKKLLEGITINQFNDIAENWYARLNRLKEYYFLNQQDSFQVENMIIEMIARMEVISFFYIRLNQSPAPPKTNYKNGAAIVSEQKPEGIIFHGEKIIPSQTTSSDILFLPKNHRL